MRGRKSEWGVYIKLEYGVAGQEPDWALIHCNGDVTTSSLAKRHKANNGEGEFVFHNWAAMRGGASGS